MLKFKRIKALLLALILSLSLTACSEEVTSAIVDEVIDIAVSEVVDVLTEESGETADAESPPAQEESSAEEVPEETPAEEVPAIDEDGYYTTKEDVALYIHTYGHLPDNFITKKEAESLGWSGGGLDDYAYGCSIGGNRFGNYEGLLPEANGRTYTECDIDTMHASKRGAKRIVFSNDGLIYYTDDHYESFTLLYGEE